MSGPTTSYQSSFIFVPDLAIACDSSGLPLFKLLRTDVDLLREKSLFRKLKRVDTTPRSSFHIVNSFFNDFSNFGQSCRRRTSNCIWRHKRLASGLVRHDETRGQNEIPNKLTAAIPVRPSPTGHFL